MTRRPEVSARTKAAILGAARRLFAHKGFAEASMREIAAASGVSKAAIYHYFRDKDRLYLLLLEEAIRALTAVMRGVLNDAPAVIQMGRLVVLNLRFAEEHPDLIRMLVHEELRGGRARGRGRLRTLIARHQDEERAVFEAVISRGIERGEFKPVSPALSADALVAVVHILSAGLVLGTESRPIAEVAQNAMDVMLNGLATVPRAPEEVARLLTAQGRPAPERPKPITEEGS